MQHDPWKLATIGLALMGTTALGTGLTTAWMLRPAASATAEETAPPPAPTARLAPAPSPAVVRTAPPGRVTRVATPGATTPECGTNGDRVMRIAKPGVVGALLGAGVGAATGAIANGGKAAGKGALIGGLAGTAVGAGYGAYKTKNECGTVFNGFSGGSTPSSSSASAPPPAAFNDGQRITVYEAR